MTFKQFAKIFGEKYNANTGLSFYAIYGRDTKLFNIFIKDYADEKELWKMVDDFFNVWSNKYDTWLSAQDPDIRLFYTTRGKIQFSLKNLNEDRELI